MALGDLGKKVSEALSQTIKGVGDVSKSAIEVTRSNVAEGLRGVRDVVTEASGQVTPGK